MYSVYGRTYVRRINKYIPELGRLRRCDVGEQVSDYGNMAACWQKLQFALRVGL